ncbi:MAG: hypothetical protein JO212_13370 [Acetobacteraceae bacterium]|nr:hypothetical protein [Acetobacteraceae bacterium]
MAKMIMLKHKESGLMKRGYYGFSWTTLFFGFWPALFRADFATFLGSLVVYLVLGLATFGIGSLLAGIVWAFLYNRYYTSRLLERGYRFDGSPAGIAEASARLGVATI